MTTKSAVPAKYPRATGIIKVRCYYGSGFRPEFLKECMTKEMEYMYECDKACTRTTEFDKEFSKNIKYIRSCMKKKDTYVFTNFSVAPTIVQKAEARHVTENGNLRYIEPDACAGNSIMISVSVDSGDDSDNEHFDADLDIAKYLYAMPEWHDSTIEMTVHPSDFGCGATNVLIPFYIYGERVFSAEFTKTIEAWWRRTITAYTVEQAVCRIENGDYSKILTERDIDRKFMSHVKLQLD